MASKYRNSFFDTKREWSKYKDAVLNYYLRPYLQKVKEIKVRGIRKPICIVDMFAGRGEFKTGEPGSPLIIAGHLRELVSQGYQVQLRCYENYEPYSSHLARVLKPFSFAEVVPKDCFTDIAEIAKLASTHTVLLYIDPCDVAQLSLSKLALVFDYVRQNASVEALIVFMARAFMRQAAWVGSVDAKLAEVGAFDDPLVLDADDDETAMWLDAVYGENVSSKFAQSQKSRGILMDIAGGDYWEDLVADRALHWEERVARLVDEYRAKLRSWFNVVEALPVQPDTTPVPKYWIVFASRYEPAFDLFNRAACDMVRSQELNAKNKPGTLFAGISTEPDTPSPQAVDRVVRLEAKSHASIRWNELRWRICGNRNVGKFTDSEVNQSIKRLIKLGFLRGASGEKVEEEATLTPTDQLRS